MINDSEFKKLETEIEQQRASIVDLQGRVTDLVKRRLDSASTGKPEAISELQRKIDTLKEDQGKVSHAVASPASERARAS
jgi:hypothetical protein